MYKKVLNSKKEFQHNKDLHIQELELLEVDELELDELDYNVDILKDNWYGIYTEAERKNILIGDEEIHYNSNENNIILKSNGFIDHIDSGIFPIYGKKVIKTK
jgi:hypothetical protein